jgi:molybdenum cofactor cytidylyltransferase
MKDSVWTIILAAGGSIRFGDAKALAPWRGGTLLSNATNIAVTVSGKRVLIVTGGHAARIESVATVQTVFNQDWETGLGSSIATGARTVMAEDKNASSLLILPVDQPFVTPEHLAELAAKALERNAIILTGDNGMFGPPAGVPASLFSVLVDMRGDRGLKALLHGALPLMIQNACMLRDVDTPDDLARLNKEI